MIVAAEIFYIYINGNLNNGCQLGEYLRNSCCINGIPADLVLDINLFINTQFVVKVMDIY